MPAVAMLAAAANATAAVAGAAATALGAAAPPVSTVTTAAASTAAWSPSALALRDGGLTLSANGSGFLIFFYVGVLLALERAGVITPGVTPMGGVSGGAIAVASFHAGLNHEQRLQATTALNARCHPTNGCPGVLGQAVREELDRFFPPDAYRRAAPPATAIFVSKVKGNATAIAGARPNTLLLPAVAETIGYDNNDMFLDGLAASSYIPKWSGAARFMAYRGQAVYDGGPTAGGRSCPPLAPGLSKNASTYCIRIECTVGSNAGPVAGAANASGRRALRQQQSPLPQNKRAPAAGSPAAIAAADAMAEDIETMHWAPGGGAAGDSPTAGRNGNGGGDEGGGDGPPDIYIGMPDAPRVKFTRDQVRMYTLLTMPPQHIPYFVKAGEQAAEAWMAKQTGLKEAAAAFAASRRAAAAKN
jgi:hypothetical protein